MSEYIRLYRLRQDKRWKLKSIKKKSSPDKYWALKDEIDELSEQIEKLRREDDGLFRTSRTCMKDLIYLLRNKVYGREKGH